MLSIYKSDWNMTTKRNHKVMYGGKVFFISNLIDMLDRHNLFTNHERKIMHNAFIVYGLLFFGVGGVG